MEVGALLVGEEQVGLPQTLEHLGIDGERVGLEVLRQLQSRVVPALPQEDVDSVILSGTTDTSWMLLKFSGIGGIFILFSLFSRGFQENTVYFMTLVLGSRSLNVTIQEVSKLGKNTFLTTHSLDNSLILTVSCAVKEY